MCQAEAAYPPALYIKTLDAWSPVNFPSWQHFIQSQPLAGELSVSSVTPLGRAFRSLCLVSLTLPHVSFPSSDLALYPLVIINYSCVHHYLLSPVPLLDDSPNVRVPPKNLPYPTREAIPDLGICQKEGIGVGSDSISHVKPFLDFNFSVFSLSWSWRKRVELCSWLALHWELGCNMLVREDWWMVQDEGPLNRGCVCVCVCGKSRSFWGKQKPHGEWRRREERPNEKEGKTRK